MSVRSHLEASLNNHSIITTLSFPPSKPFPDKKEHHADLEENSQNAQICLLVVVRESGTRKSKAQACIRLCDRPDQNADNNLSGGSLRKKPQDITSPGLIMSELF